MIVPISGTVTWKSDRISSRYASNSSSARSISSISRTGATPSVNSSACRSGRRIRKSLPEDVVRAGVLGLATGLEQADLEHLPRVVPLVDRGVDVEALVALQPDEARPEAGGEHLRELGLADARLAFEQQRTAKLQRQEHGRRKRPVRDVVPSAEVVLDALDRLRADRPVRAIARGFGRGLCHGADATRPSGEVRRRDHQPSRDRRHVGIAP